MKKCLSVFLALLLVLSLSLTCGAAAAGKDQEPRTIAIVFDNSGSMYTGGNQAWCRATYAMEVFASMLNRDDRLCIYPMNPISVNGTEYTMSSPLTITGPDQASVVRSIETPVAAGTPIESIDAAYEGLRNVIGEKWLIVLTDGGQFCEGNVDYSAYTTTQKLSDRLTDYGAEMNVLYLGIGIQAAVPTVPSQGRYVAGVETASDSGQVLSKLTSMCNLIFGRDSLPPTHINGSHIEFDLSVGKAIVFVQGRDVSDVRMTSSSGTVQTAQSAYSVRYSENGARNYKSTPDSNLQGMIVTYGECAVDSYTIDYSGSASGIEVYYEPDVDLVFTFTDASGREVDPHEALYEGDYTVSFGLLDKKTGRLTESVLLGNTDYEVTYSVNGVENTVHSTDKVGSVTQHLSVGDTFDATITATYLSGYTITKSGEDFGWPAGGLNVVPAPAGMLELRISGGDAPYILPTLEDGAPFIAEIWYEGEKLTDDALESTELWWDPDRSSALLLKEAQGDHYEISLHYKDDAHPENTVCGPCTLEITAEYTPPASESAFASAQMTYSIEDSSTALSVDLRALQDYYVISSVEEGEGLKAYLTVNGLPLADPELAEVEFEADAGGIPCVTQMLPGESAYLIRFGNADGIEPGIYDVTATATVADEIGRTETASDTESVELRSYPEWLRWAAISLLILLVLLLLFLFLNHKVLPKKIIRSAETDYTIGGKTIDDQAKVKYSRKGKTLELIPPDAAGYAYVNCSARLDLKPASPRITPSARRQAQVVRVRASDGISSIDIGAATYQRDDAGNFVKDGTSPTYIRNNSTISVTGTAMTAQNRRKTAMLSQQLKFK